MLKQVKHKKKFIALPAVFMIAIVVAVFAISPNAKAAQYSADVNADRENGVCNYILAGIDTAQTSGMTTMRIVKWTNVKDSRTECWAENE